MEPSSCKNKRNAKKFEKLTKEHVNNAKCKCRGGVGVEDG